MSSRAKKRSAANAKMYRHFAVITLIITAVMGFVTSEEPRQAAVNQIDKVEQRIENERQADQKKYGSKILVNNAVEREAASGWSGGDGVGSYGQPMDAVGASVSESGFAPAMAYNDAEMDPNDLTSYGARAEQVEELSDEEKKRLLEAAKRARYGNSAEARATQIADLTKASANRASKRGSSE